MGNSHSIGQFTPNEIDLRQRAHWQYLSQQQQQQHNHQSRVSDPNNTSIKVLPELNDTSGHLRSTDNGVILFNGGTISGRRDSSGVGIVRSKSISSPQHEYMRGLQRHKTQLDMPVGAGRIHSGMGLRRDVDPKLFGSEPDLRADDAAQHHGRNSRKFKGQPKLLTTNHHQQEHQQQQQQQQQQEQQQRDYDSTRFGWRPKSHQPQGQQQQTHNNQRQDRMPSVPETPKKARLFKTREETKKVSSKANQSKLATEASDVLQSKKPAMMPGRQNNGKRDAERIRDDSTTDRVIKVIGNRPGGPGVPCDKLLPKAEVLSKPVFRREKSFDISLLLSRGAQKGTSLFPNVFRKSSTTDKSPPVVQHGKVIPTNHVPPHPPPSRPENDKSLKSRRSSQPPPRPTDKDFQKELQEATRRRSMLAPPPLKDANKTPSIVTQMPVLKALSKPGRSSGQQAKENARPSHQKSKAPKPPQSSNVVANKIQLEIRNDKPSTAAATNPVIELQPHTAIETAAPTPGEGEVSGVGAGAEKQVKSFYYGMAEKERTGNATPAKVNGFHERNGSHGQVGDVHAPTVSQRDTTAEGDATDKGRGEDEQQQQQVHEPLHHQHLDAEQKVELTAIESFAESIFATKKNNPQQQQRFHPQRDSSESAVSSFVDEPLLSPPSALLLYPGSLHPNKNGDFHTMDLQDLQDAESLKGISLQLRPTLPKKQFEIPRFSPAAAWRLLTTAETTREVTSQLKDRTMMDSQSSGAEEQNEAGSLGSREEDDSSAQNQETESRGGEEQIERIYREPIPGLADNKSGDSGISGDGGLLELGDSSPTTNLLVNDLRKLGPFLQPWTPQQDLEDDSSSDPDPVEHNNLNESHGAGRAATASGHSRLLKDLSTMEDVVAQKHVFSLSLPRDNHHSVGANLLDKGVGAVASSLVGSDKHFFSSLQKTKLGHCYSDAAAGRSQQAAAGNDNWFLGRSQPNSIEKSHPMPSLSDNEDVVSLTKLTGGQHQPAIQPPSFNYLAGGCHFMYLPNRPSSMSLSSSHHQNHSVHGGNSTTSLTNGTITNNNGSPTGKVNNGPPPKPMRENLQDERAVDEDDHQETVWNVPLRMAGGGGGGRKGRRFTFQSTVRQIERRKIADKLSREAEEREVQRLSELEAMDKVEQEFQMKRAREKASIRQQLRLFSLEANSQQNQSHQYDEDYSPSSIRREPDGAAETLLSKMNGCHSALSSTSLMLELNGYHQHQPAAYQSMRMATSTTVKSAAGATAVPTNNNNNFLSRDYSKFPYREFLK